MNQIEEFTALLDTMKLMYIAKNHDYGNSFEKSCNEYGITAALVRMEDKFNRLKSLRNKDPKIVTESIKDTLIDLANYSLMTRMWIDNNDNKNKEV